MYDLTAFQRDLLFTVAGLDAPNGLTVKEHLEERYDQQIRHGRLYPNLDTLVEKGLIEKGKRDQRTNKYLLRDRGRREIVAQLEWELEQTPEELLPQRVAASQ